MDNPLFHSYCNLAVFDYEELIERLQGDTEITHLVLHAFVKNIGPKINELVDHAEKNDIPALLKQTHAIKGAAGSISALALHKMTIDLEEAGKALDTKQISKLTQLISSHYSNQLRAALQQQLGS